jgi:hypothetical protein
MVISEMVRMSIYRVDSRKSLGEFMRVEKGGDPSYGKNNVL